MSTKLSPHCIRGDNPQTLFSIPEQNPALWAKRSLARLGTPQAHARHASARTWHAMATREACHHAIRMPRRATLVPPLCLWHASLVPRPAPLCAGRGAHLACPWPVTHFYSTITVCYCNASYTQTHATWSPKAKLLLFPTG